MYWRKSCTIAAILLLLSIVWLNQCGSPIARYQLKEDVAQYLHNLGYTEEEIVEMKTEYHPGEQNKYVVRVVLQKDGKTSHYYGYGVDQEIQEVENWNH